MEKNVNDNIQDVRAQRFKEVNEALIGEGLRKCEEFRERMFELDQERRRNEIQRQRKAETRSALLSATSGICGLTIVALIIGAIIKK